MSAYLLIGVLLAVFIVRRQFQRPVWRRTLWLFVAFLLACAIDHAAEIIWGHISILVIFEAIVSGWAAFVVWSYRHALAAMLHKADIEGN